MKKTKVIIPALGILLLSTAASVTGTVAWFSMNNNVFATGMMVQAKSENGIVISATGAADSYDETASKNESTATAMRPASTGNCKDFYSSKSTSSSAANTAQDYTKLSSGTVDGINYYVAHDFFIRSSTNAAIEETALNIKKVSVERTDSTQALSSALRVGIIFDEDYTKPYIYAPVGGFTTSYAVRCAADDAVDPANPKLHTQTVQPIAGTTLTASHVTTIPAKSEDPINAKVFIWFEGEDAECISDNLEATLDSITVTVNFSANLE